MRSNVIRITKDQEQFNCRRCGACCKDRDVPLALDDIFRLSDLLNMDPDQFFKDYCVEVAESSDNIALPFLRRENNKCCFLEDNICQVHFMKPSICEHLPSTMFGSLEYLRTKMPEDCAIHQTKPNNDNDERKRKNYITAMMLTTIYYSKHGTFSYETAKPFIYRILLFKKNRNQIYRLMGTEVMSN
jgi:uncharacterized protein